MESKYTNSVDIVATCRNEALAGFILFKKGNVEDAQEVWADYEAMYAGLSASEKAQVCASVTAHYQNPRLPGWKAARDAIAERNRVRCGQQTVARAA